MLGQYVADRLHDHKIVCLPASDRLDISAGVSVSDILALDPTPDTAFDLVVHAAGTSDPARAMQVNLEGTRHLLKALAKLPQRPRALTYISCYSVYSPDAGEMADETTPLDAADETGRSKALAEKEARLWARAAGVPLTILRPGLMFGTGVSGLAAEMFKDVIAGRYIHVRGQEGRISVVTALDVADAVAKTAGIDGVFNVADDSSPRWLDLAEAMSANAGALKRMVTLPPKWADQAWRFCRAIPAVAASLRPAVRERRSVSLTLNSAKLRQTVDWHHHNTLEVLARTDRDYPYQEK